MKAIELFTGGSSTGWVAYDGYEIIGERLHRCITSSVTAKPREYDPLAAADGLVCDAVNVGLLVTKLAGYDAIEKAMLDFHAKYGLLGFITALPTTPDFFEYETVFLPKNPVTKAARYSVAEYMKIFFPQVKEDLLLKRQKAHQWLFDGLLGDEPPIGVGDREVTALYARFKGFPEAQRRSFQRGYAEPCTWVEEQFRDWASMFLSAHFYFEERDSDFQELHRHSLLAYPGIAPHYKIVLKDRIPSLQWNFHSLLQTIGLLLSLMMTDGSRPLRLCPECEKAFIAKDSRAVFCSHDCKNRHNVRRSRQKNAAPEDGDED
jgi:predicted nucleic acid-binding Zn ribbon protein